MKSSKRSSSPLRGLFLLAWGSLMISSASAVEVQLERISETSDSSELPMHQFADQEVPLTFSVDAPLGSRFDLVAEISLIQGTLKTPLEKNRLLKENLSFERETHQILHLSYKTPPTQSLCKIHFETFLKPKTSNEKVVQGKAFDLYSYPKTEKNLVKAYIESNSTTGFKIAVVGKSEPIRSFFIQHKIPCYEGGLPWNPIQQKNTLPIGSATPQEIDQILASTEMNEGILFIDPIDQTQRLPGVYQIPTTPKRSLWIVNLPLLNDLETNPLSQRIFIQTLQQITKTNPPL
jgi:hypothetical protein